jgi:hypothetical protein
MLIATWSGCGESDSALSKIDPQAATAEAMRTCDTNSDGQLEAKELAAVPSLKSTLKHVDTDSDGRISTAELQTRLAQLFADPVAFTNVQCTVTRGGRPLSAAEVRLIPEPFLGEALHEATGTTDEFGATQLAVAPENMPADMKDLQLMQVGLYRVEVKHPSVTAPPKEPLGAEIDPARRGGTNVAAEL